MTQPSVSEPTPGRDRVVWVDYAKGLSILLVVVYHVWNGIMKQPQIASPTDWYDPINRAFEMMRMPLFFFVSGLFIGRSVQKPASVFIKDKMCSIIWPYLIWSCVHVAVILLLTRWTGNASEFTIPMLPYRLAFDPVAQFWFLYVLFMALMLYFGLTKLKLPPWAILVTGLGLILVKLNVDLSAIGFETARYKIGLIYWGPLYQLMNFFIYMAFGAVLAPVLLSRMDRQPTWVVGLYAVAVMATIGLAVMKVDPSLVSRDATQTAGIVRLPVGIIFALMSVAGGLCAAVMISRCRGLGFVRMMGRYSLYIFVMHVIFAAGMRGVLLKVGIVGFSSHLIAGLLVGILMPILVAVIVKRLGMTGLFTLRGG